MTKRFFIATFLSASVFGFVFSNCHASDNIVSVPDHLIHMQKSKNERCKINQKATITINIGKQADTFKELSLYSKELTTQAFEHAQKLNIADFSMRNSNLNIQPSRQNYSFGTEHKYQISGTINFESEDLEKSIEYADVMSQKGFRVHYRENKNVPHCRH